MKNIEPVDNPDLKHMWSEYPARIETMQAGRLHHMLFFYLIPIIGFFPSLWTLYRGRGSREQLAVSRLSITLAGSWLLGYLLLGFGAETSEFLTLRLLVLNTLLTSGYFLVSIWLIVRLSSHKSVRLPGFSRWAERVLGKYLS